jgi:hypothetical protein
MKKKRLLLSLLFLSIFFSVTLFANFFHTERTVDDNDNCPACHFLNSTFLTTQIHLFHLPPLTSEGLVETFSLSSYVSSAVALFLTRAPPSA